MDYAFDKVTRVGKFEVMVDSTAQYGYFEHEDYGDECGGGLWFEDGSLVDYDGVACLPLDVATALEQLGFVVDKSFTD